MINLDMAIFSSNVHFNLTKLEKWVAEYLYFQSYG